MIGGALAAEISSGLLIDVERDDPQWRPVPSTVPRVANQETVAHVLRVGLISPDRRDDGDSLGRNRGSHNRADGTDQRCGTQGAEKGASSNFHVLQKVDCRVGL